MIHQKAKDIVKRHRTLIIVGLVAAALIGSIATSIALFQKPVPASSGNIYTDTPSAQIKSGEKLSLAVRISPGAEVDTVTASVTYDKGALAYSKATYTDSPFSSQIPAATKDNTVTVQSAKLGGQTVKSDSLIAVLEFTASKDSPSLPMLVYGNAARAGIATNPTVMGRAADESKNPFAAPTSGTAVTGESDATSAESPAFEPIVGALKSIGVSDDAARMIAPWIVVAVVTMLIAVSVVGGFIYYRRRHPKQPKGVAQ